MPFHLIDAFVGGSAITSVIVLAYFLASYVRQAPVFPTDFVGVGSVFVFFAAVILLTALLGRVVHYFLPIAPGTFSIKTPDRRGTIWKLQGFLNLFNLSVLVHTYLLPVNLRWILYRLLGSRIGSSVMMGGKIIEPIMVEIGDFVILGEDSLVLGHSIVGDRVTLGRVVIGSHVTIGAKAIVMPGVEIGAGAVIAAGALVPIGARIGPGELWGGIPAKRMSSGENV